MKRNKRFFALLLVLLVLPGLFACGKDGEAGDKGEIAVGDGAVDSGMVEGYVTELIQPPEEVDRISNLGFARDKLYVLGGNSQTYLLYSYDIAGGEWKKLPFDGDEFGGTNSLGYLDYGVRTLRVAGDSLWVMVEQYQMDTNSVQRPVTIMRYSVEDGSLLNKSAVTIEAAAGTESSTRIFTYFCPLDSDKAILADPENTYLINGRGEVLDSLTGTGLSSGAALSNGEKLLLSSFQQDSFGYVEYDMETGEFGPFTMGDIPYGTSISELGNFYGMGDEGLEKFDPATGEKSLVFRWLDTASSLEYADGGSSIYQSSAGDFYYLAISGSSVIQKVSPGLVKEKTEIRVLGPGDRGMINAVLTFNATDPDYKIVLQSGDELQQMSDQERIAFITGEQPDIINLSLLPGVRLDSGLVTDLMPYLEADSELSREDFIQPVFEAMLDDGCLYSIQPSISVLSFASRASDFPGREEWTIDYVNQLIANRGENTPVYFWHRDRNYMLDMLCLMASAEYVDWETGQCSFDQGGFGQWLQFVKDTPYTDVHTQDAVLFEPCDGVYSFMAISGMFNTDDIAYAGFPGTAGSGSYFINSLYNESSFAVMASSQYKEQAWRFLKLILTDDDSFARQGLSDIPVLKKSFEATLEARINEDDSEKNYFYFPRAEADRIKDLVYSIDKIASRDEQLKQMISTEAQAYFLDQKSLEETVANIQSKVSIYVAEQS